MICSSLGVPVKSFDTDTQAAPVTGTVFALPAPEVAKTITWQTSFASAPGSCTIKLEGSIDGTNWATLDTSTATAGEIRTVTAGASLFVRGNKSAQNTTDALTLQFVCSLR